MITDVCAGLAKVLTVLVSRSTRLGFILQSFRLVIEKKLYSSSSFQKLRIAGFDRSRWIHQNPLNGNRNLLGFLKQVVVHQFMSFKIGPKTDLYSLSSV